MHYFLSTRWQHGTVKFTLNNYLPSFDNYSLFAFCFSTVTENRNKIVLQNNLNNQYTTLPFKITTTKPKQ